MIYIFLIGINYDIVIPKKKKNYYNIAIYLYICLFIKFA